MKQVFIKLNWGFVERVDVIRVKSKDGKMVKRAFIHFAPMKWNMRSQMARATLTALQKGEVIKVSYEEEKPWFWTVTVSKCMKPELSDLKEKSLRHKSMRKEKLDLSKVSHQKVSIKRRSDDDELLKKKNQNQKRQTVSQITVNLDDPISARAASTSPTESRGPVTEQQETSYDPMMEDTFA